MVNGDFFFSFNILKSLLNPAKEYGAISKNNNKKTSKREIDRDSGHGAHTDTHPESQRAPGKEQQQWPKTKLHGSYKMRQSPPEILARVLAFYVSCNILYCTYIRCAVVYVYLYTYRL